MIDKFKKFLVVVAHPDDDVLGCGGTIANLIKQKKKLKVVFIAEGTYWVKDFCQMLIDIGHKAPTFTPPIFLVKFLSNFDKGLKQILPLLGVDMEINTDIAKTLLNFKPIPIKKTIKETSDYISSYD